jgi:hypothetical protein
MPNMLEIIRAYMKKDWNFSLHQTLRESNAWVDILAKLGVNRMDTLVTVYELPQFLSSALLVNIVEKVDGRTQMDLLKPPQPLMLVPCILMLPCLHSPSNTVDDFNQILVSFLM